MHHIDVSILKLVDDFRKAVGVSPEKHSIFVFVFTHGFVDVV